MRRTSMVTILLMASVVLALAVGPFVRGFAQAPAPPAGDEFNSSAFQAPFAAYCGVAAAQPCPDAQAAGKWNLNQESPGQLRIWTQPGTLLGTGLSGSNNARNLILQPANAGADYTITTKLTFPANTSSVNALGQTAGIMTYQDDDNFIYVGRTFVSGGSQLQFVQEVGGVDLTSAVAETSILATVYLRIVKTGTSYSGYYSFDINGPFNPITLSSGTATPSPLTPTATSTLTPTATATGTATSIPTAILTSTPQAGASYQASYSSPKVGLFAWGGLQAGASTSQYAADFDWFRVGNSSIPAPTATVTGTTTPATSTATTTTTATTVATATTAPTSTTVPTATTAPTATKVPIPTPTPRPPPPPVPSRPRFQYISVWYHYVKVGTHEHLEVQGSPHVRLGIWVHVYFPNGHQIKYYQNTNAFGHWRKNINVHTDAIGRKGNVVVITLRLWHGPKTVQSFAHFTLVR